MRVTVLLTIAIATILAATSVSARRPEYVSTPVGRILKECNHRVPSGSHLSPLPEGGLRVTDSHGKFLKTIPSCDRRNGTIPLFEPSPLYRRRRSHSSTRGHSRKLLQFPPDYEGWLAYTAFEYPDGLDAFWGNFSVPDQPSEVPDVLYIFTGLQNIDWIPIVDPEPSTPFDIIQPVLQYPGDEGNYWSVKSWYVTLDVGTVASDEVQLNVGDVIFGNMTRTGPTGWYIGSTSVETGNTTYVTVTNDRLASQPWAYNTLECYGCDGCGTFPENPCHFTDLLLVSKGNVIVPQWKVNPKPSKNKQCKEIPVVNDPTSVDIDFQ